MQSTPPHRPVNPSTPPDGPAASGAPEPPLTLERLAEAKGFDPAFLEQLGIRDDPPHGVAIDYRDQAGQLLFTRHRVSLDPERRRFDQPAGARLALYGLWRLPTERADKSLWLVEGESDALALWSVGEPALAIPGAGAWACVQPDHVAGWGRVCLLLDNDQAGADLGRSLLAHLRRHNVATPVYEAKLPAGVKDACDLRQREGAEAFAAALLDLAVAAVQLHPAPAAGRPGAPADGGHAGNGDGRNRRPAASPPAGAEEPRKARAERKKGPLPADDLLALALEAGVYLFHDRHDAAYVRFPAELGHPEVRPVESVAFADWLRILWEKKRGRVVPKNALGRVVEALASKARRLGPSLTVFNRVAGLGGANYLDLGDGKGTVIRVTADGWARARNPASGRPECPVHFGRWPGMDALPYPQDPCPLDRLFDYVHAPDLGTRALILTWLLHALQPDPIFAALIVSGPPGSGKTFAAWALASLVDPRGQSGADEPEKPWDAWIEAHKRHVSVFNNLEEMPRWFNRFLCRLAEGGGASRKKNYTDQDTSDIWKAAPVITTSVEDVIVRGDMLTRGIPVRLDPLDGDLVAKEKLERCYQTDRPKLLAALLDALVLVLRNLDRVGEVPEGRCADYARYGVAAELAGLWPAGTFAPAYRAAQDDAMRTAAGALCWVEQLEAVLDDHGGEWTCSATELLEAMTAKLPTPAHPPKGWPARAHFLAGRLKAATQALRAVGVEVARTERSKKQRPLIVLRRLDEAG